MDSIFYFSFIYLIFLLSILLISFFKVTHFHLRRNILDLLSNTDSGMHLLIIDNICRFACNHFSIIQFDDNEVSLIYHLEFLWFTI